MANFKMELEMKLKARNEIEIAIENINYSLQRKGKRIKPKTPQGGKRRRPQKLKPKKRT